MSRPTTSQAPRAWLAVGLLATTLFSAGCPPKSTPDPAEAERQLPPAPRFETVWREAEAAQDLRLERMERVYASGQVELRWTDDDGSHFEFCRGELFVRLPAETALSLTKVGERFFWLGSDARRRWLFDLRTKSPVLWLVDLDAPVPAAARRSAAGEQAPLPVRRVALVDLFGLTALPPAVELDAVFDGAPGTLVGEFFGEGGPVRVVLDVDSSLPRRVEALDDEGRAFLRCDLEEYEAVEREGLGPGALPRFPTRIVLAVVDPFEPDAPPSSEIKLFLTPSLRGEDRITDRLFDLPTLEKMLKPVKTERR
jgi:hypothetical protein